MAATVLVISAGAVQVGDWLLQAGPIRQLEPMRVKHVGRDAGLDTVCLFGDADSGARLVVVLASDQVRVERQVDAEQHAERLRSVGARPGGHGELARRLRAADQDEWVNAHARLLKAAPELYEAASLALGYFASYATGENEASEHFRRLRAALAKARGEAPRG